MKKKSLIAMLLVIFAFTFAANIFSQDDPNGNEPGVTAVHHDGLHGSSSGDTNGTFVPD